jgi:hypothetical protein
MAKFASRWVGNLLVGFAYAGSSVALLDYVRNSYGVLAGMGAFALQTVGGAIMWERR